MAQHDYVIANGTGAAVRSDLNNALAAIVSNNSGATEPATMYAYQWWADTSTGLLKLRNAANNAWITLRELDGTLTIEDGTASSPGLAFADDLNTGIYSPSADQLGITTGGTVRLTTTTTGITSALPVDVPLGTASAPTVTFTGDLNTGIYSPGADQVAISTNGTGRVFINSSGSVGIGSSSPSVLTHLSTSTDTQLRVESTSGSGTNEAALQLIRGSNQSAIKNKAGGIEFFVQGLTNEIARFDSSGRLGIGTTSPDHLLHLSSPLTGTTAFSNVIATIRSQAANRDASLQFADGTKSSAISGLSGNLIFGTNVMTEAARINTSGRLLVGTSTALAAGGSLTPVFQIAGADQNSCTQMIRGAGSLQPSLAFTRSNGSIASPTAVTSGDGLGGILFEGHDGTNPIRAALISAVIDGTPGANDMPGRLVFSTTADGASSPTERMRIHSNGDVGIGLTGQFPGDNNTTNGVYFEGNGKGFFSRSAAVSLLVNRNDNDGNLAEFRQNGTLEGTISVSGTTVSYNGAHLSRWSQLPSGQERIEILRGSVLSNIDEMCEWGEEDNEQLNRMKVSDIEGDKNVSGVFQAWDDDDDTYTNDFYCAMTGDFIIRIAAGVTVERGDLLMSAGDGTAKPQDDDIIRSKTIAKVTSTNVSCTYDDGSYCVPCVLMAC